MYSMFQEGRLQLVLYTDALVTRGTIRTGQHRVSDVLNHADEAFLVLEDVTVDELGSRGTTTRSDYAQVNLDAVLFAVATTTRRPCRSCGRRRRPPKPASRSRRSRSSARST